MSGYCAGMSLAEFYEMLERREEPIGYLPVEDLEEAEA